MKPILRTEINGNVVFVVGNVCNGTIRAEQALGIKFEPTGLLNDKFGLSYVRSRGLVFSLQGFKQWQGIK